MRNHESLKSEIILIKRVMMLTSNDEIGKSMLSNKPEKLKLLCSEHYSLLANLHAASLV